MCRLWASIILAALLTSSVAGCDRASDEFVETVVPPASADEPTPPIIHTNAGVPTAPETSVILLPTIGFSPLPTPAPGIAPAVPQLDDVPEEITIPATPFVVCTSQTEVVECYDALLDLHFTYPEFMGFISETTLRRGGIAGYTYVYLLENGYAGGLSNDFSEGRGGMITDHWGFGGRTAGEFCASKERGICREVKPGVVYWIEVSPAEWLCDTDSMTPFAVTPLVILELDLPTHSLLAGFGFTAPLIPPDTTPAWEVRRGNSELCDLVHQAIFDAQIAQLLRDVMAGSAEPEIQARYDGLLRLAESLESSYLPQQ